MMENNPLMSSISNYLVVFIKESVLDEYKIYNLQKRATYDYYAYNTRIINGLQTFIVGYSSNSFRRQCGG